MNIELVTFRSPRLIIAVYDFFMDRGSYFFHSLIKSTVLSGKDLLRLDDKQNNNGHL